MKILKFYTVKSFSNAVKHIGLLPNSLPGFRGPPDTQDILSQSVSLTTATLRQRMDWVEAAATKFMTTYLGNLQDYRKLPHLYRIVFSCCTNHYKASELIAVKDRPEIGIFRARPSSPQSYLVLPQWRKIDSAGLHLQLNLN